MSHPRRKLPTILKALQDGLCRVVMLVIIVLMAVMVASMCAQVFWRYVPNDSLSIWPEEVSRYAFIWVSCLGMSVGVRRGDLIAIDVLWAGRPKRVRLFISIVARVLIIPLLIVFAWEGWVLIDVVAGHAPLPRMYRSGGSIWHCRFPPCWRVSFMLETLARDIRELSLFGGWRRMTYMLAIAAASLALLLLLGSGGLRTGAELSLGDGSVAWNASSCGRAKRP